MALKSRYCRVCGELFKPVRFDALTCCGTCRTRKCRGGDLVYLETWPADRASARRMLHEAVDFEIATMRDVGAARREGRQARRGMLRVQRIKIASPEDHLARALGSPLSKPSALS
jgi:hypothetical protein